ncbi:MAG: acyltransferase family protein [Actinomycetota bacterium]
MSADQASGSLERMPALDGLRALAVYLVVAFHAGVARFEGGFIGVDVFFVLSGFLITRLLIAEHATAGRLDLGRFYARRARRLLPAAWVTVLVVGVVYVAFSNGVERASALDDARAAVLYFANWHFIGAGQDYFAESIASSPFLHLWSLAVEEQFYLVWPLASVAVLALWRRRPAAATVGVVLIAGVAAWWASAVASDDLLRAYYGTDTRAYQLLGGAGLAFLLSEADGRPRRPLGRAATEAALAAGLVGVFAAAMRSDTDAVDRGMVAAALTLALVAAVAGRRPGTAGPVEAALSSRPMVALGGLSYATYLWHWPIVILLERTFVLSATTRLVVVALVSTGLAKLSMDLVERPVRRRDVGNRATIVVGLAGTLLIGLIAVPAVFRADVAQVRAAERPGFTPAPVTVTVTVPVEAAPVVEPPDPVEVEPPAVVAVPVTGPVPDDLGAIAVVSTFGERAGCINDIPTALDECLVVDGAGTRVMLIGDSHASKLNIAFAEHAVENDLAYVSMTSNGCAWQRGLEYANALPVAAARQACRDLRDVHYDQLVPAFEPDVVVLVSHGFDTNRYAVTPREGWPLTEGLADEALVEAASAETIDELLASGTEVVIVEPIPTSTFNVAACLSGAELIEECAFVAGTDGSDTAIYRQLAAERADVRTVDMDRLACPAYPLCDAIVGSVQVREDRDHLYGAYVMQIRDDLMAEVGLS